MQYAKVRQRASMGLAYLLPRQTLAAMSSISNRHSTRENVKVQPCTGTGRSVKPGVSLAAKSSSTAVHRHLGDQFFIEETLALLLKFPAPESVLVMSKLSA